MNLSNTPPRVHIVVEVEPDEEIVAQSPFESTTIVLSPTGGPFYIPQGDDCQDGRVLAKVLREAADKLEERCQLESWERPLRVYEGPVA